MKASSDGGLSLLQLPAANSKPFLLLLACLVLLGSLTSAQGAAQTPDAAWPTYGNDAGGQRFSSAAQITRENVQQLRPAWIFHTHAIDSQRMAFKQASFEATPVLSDGVLFFPSPFDQVFAVDASTGKQLWTYDPKPVLERDDVLITSRGVALWGDPKQTGPCAFRVLLGTLDARLLALDGHTGVLCADFGRGGVIDLKSGIHFRDWGGYSITSPPTVLGNVVVVGSSVQDNHEVGPESGLVRAFDVVTGKPLWQWEPIPWGESTHPRTGAANVWSVISADPELGLLYLPTSSPAPDYFGGLRKGNNQDADSVVALDARTGRKVWAFQTVHHNIWDYDIPSEPVLFNWHGSTDSKRSIPAVAVTTKTGQVFVLDRRTGVPLVPVQERPVPQSTVPGEQSSPTQPFAALPNLADLAVGVAQAGSSGWQRPAASTSSCQSQMAGMHYAGMFTPPGTQGTLLFPGNLGGVNWGGAAVSPEGVLYASVNREAFRVQLLPRGSWRVWWMENEVYVRAWPVWIYLGGAILLVNLFWRLGYRRRRQPALRVPWIPAGWPLVVGIVVMAVSAPMWLYPMTQPVYHFGHEVSLQLDSPYLISRDPFIDQNGLPCVAPPWGALTALDLNAGHIVWRTPLGTRVPGAHTGSPTLGGPIATATGLVFAAGTDDARLRAFDAATGQELWSGALPAAGRATPMTYTIGGRQFLVIAAGGHTGVEGTRGDSLVAFTLPPAPVAVPMARAQTTR